MTQLRFERLALALLVTALWAGAPAAAATEATTMTVMVKESQVRQNPVSYAKPVAAVKLGQRVEILETKGDWYRVSIGGKGGWLHRSAVTSKKVEAGTADSIGTSRVSTDEVTLAGKGFNEQVEGEYKKKHPDLNFAAVDSLVKFDVPDDDVLRFVEEGAAEGPGGPAASPDKGSPGARDKASRSGEKEDAR